MIFADLVAGDSVFLDANTFITTMVRIRRWGRLAATRAAGRPAARCGCAGGGSHFIVGSHCRRLAWIECRQSDKIRA
jgi:hypothetical protein